MFMDIDQIDNNLFSISEFDMEYLKEYKLSLIMNLDKKKRNIIYELFLRKTSLTLSSGIYKSVD